MIILLSSFILKNFDISRQYFAVPIIIGSVLI